MSQNLKNEAAIPNPILQPFEVLIGEWITIGTHRLLPDTPLHGRASFEWLEGGAFLIWRTEIEEEGFPSAIAIIGSDDALHELFMLYFDERGVSRRFAVTLNGNVWKLWRTAPGFSQRSTSTLGENGDSLVLVWELSEDDATWKRDMEMKYTRVKRT